DPPSEALMYVCNNLSCLEKRDLCCAKTLPCGHFCCGVRNETQYIRRFLQYLFCGGVECSTLRSIGLVIDFFCKKKYFLKKNLKVYVHKQCDILLQDYTENPHILFGFARCPLCDVKISHSLLTEQLIPIQKLHKEIENRAYIQLKEDGLLKSTEFEDDGNNEWYHNCIGFAMKRYAFYCCFVCKKPYYGGLGRCADGLHEMNPSDFICPACSGIGLDSCSVHGRDYMIYKCRFCCSVASYFCWGTTHFCPDCHKLSALFGDYRRQENHDYMTTKTKENLPQCEGPDKCPLGLEHPANGEEFSLGCSLCRGADSFGRAPRSNSLPVVICPNEDADKEVHNNNNMEVDDELPNPNSEVPQIPVISHHNINPEFERDKIECRSFNDREDSDFYNKRVSLNTN
ncbi:hypothetical protein RFI_10722, partial [Reticulomyxa filosa]